MSKDRLSPLDASFLRLAEVPLAQARPRWAERFDLRYHVRNSALPAPGTECELQVLGGRVFSHRLRRDRPLWELWLVSGLDRDRFAILSKDHHALVDGISGMDILSVLFAPESGDDDRPWRLQPSPSSAGLVAEALFERATSAGELVRPLRAAVRRPRSAGSPRPPSAPARWHGRGCSPLPRRLTTPRRSAPTGVSHGRARRSATSRRSRTRSAARSTTSC